MWHFDLKFRHFCDVTNSRLGYNLPPLVNDRAISPFREGVIFMFRENKTLAKISEFTDLKCVFFYSATLNILVKSV